MTPRYYELMSKDIVVARQIEGRLDVLCPDLLPLFLRRTESVELWLSKRAIDGTRAHAKPLKKALFISNASDEWITLSC